MENKIKDTDAWAAARMCVKRKGWAAWTLDKLDARRWTDG